MAARFTLPGYHMILAVIAFGGLVWAATGLWSTLSRYPAWHRAGGPLSIIPWVMLGSVIAVVLAIRGPRLKPFFGVFVVLAVTRIADHGGAFDTVETAPPLPPPAVRIPTRTWKGIERLTRSNVGCGPRRKAGCETEPAEVPGWPSSHRPQRELC